MSSDVLTLVNKVLRITGDGKDLTVIEGSNGGIGERIVEIFNLIISDIEKAANWPVLRVNVQGIGDGTNDVFEFTGSGNVPPGAALNVWIPGLGSLEENTPAQFDVFLAEQLSGRPEIFQRGATTTNNLSIQIAPTPASGDVINISAYKKAARLTTATADTTEFDDEVLVSGAVMHMDAFDGMSRGFAQIYKRELDSMVFELHRNTNFRSMPESYR